MTGHIIAIIGTPKSGKTALGINLSAGFSQGGLQSQFIDLSSRRGYAISQQGDVQSLGTVDLSVHEVDNIKASFPITVIDFGSSLTEETQVLLEHASIVFVATKTTPKELTETQNLLNVIYRTIPKDIVYAILSRYSAKARVNPKAIKQTLGCNVLGALAEDKGISSAAPMTPIIFTHPNSTAAKYISQLVKIIRTKKILEKGELIQRKRQKVVSIHTTEKKVESRKKVEEKVASTHKKPKLYNRFSREELPRDPRTLLKLKVLKQLSTELNLKKLDTETGNDPKKMAVLRQKTRQAVMNIMEREKIFVGSKSDREQFIKEILDEALGLGPLEELLGDASITEIMVNRKDQIYIEKNGKVTLSSLTFTSDAQLLGIIERIVAPLGRRIDEKTPYVDARLPDGSRVHAIIPPLAIQGPTLTIRKFPERNFTVDDLVGFGSMTEDVADFLRAGIESRLNCVVSGGTGSGKTTLLNVLSSFIPERERIITVEDSAELRLTQPHVLRLESRPANIEGKGAIAIRDLVKNTLRMRPDRIVVGECRDGAALDMLQAMNTGHDGSLTTIHANSAKDCLARLETLVMMAGMDLPSRVIREQISSAVHLIIQIARLSDGSRKLTSIIEVTGMEGNVITSAEILKYKQTGIDAKGNVIGKFQWSGYVPQFIHELEKQGLRIPKSFLTKKTAG